jgi:hypothetical protein
VHLGLVFVRLLVPFIIKIIRIFILNVKTSFRRYFYPVFR